MFDIKPDLKTYLFLLVMTYHDYKLGVFWIAYGFWFGISSLIDLRRIRKEKRHDNL